MYRYTHNNHLQYSIGDVPFGARTNSIDKFKVSIGEIDHTQYETSDYRNELRRTADLVYRDLGKDLLVFLSGGTDSEIVVRNFVEIGVKPKCVVVKFKNDYNLDDVNEAIEICKDLDLKLEIVDLDIENFYRSGEAAEFGNTIQCSQLAYLMVYSTIKKLQFPAVMGGEVVITRNVSPTNSNWYYTFRENEDASAMRFSSLYNLPLVNEWFSYTPELLLYYLENPEIVELVTNKYNYKLSSVSSKNNILKNLYPEIRDKIKTHGFEKLRALNFEAYRTIYSSQIPRLEPSLDGIEYNKIVRQLRGSKE